jgi:hypothetical protein
MIIHEEPVNPVPNTWKSIEKSPSGKIKSGSNS